MEKRVFWMALVALVLSIGTIGVMIMSVWEMSIIDSNTFISTMVGLMALVFTLLVGYQIYNAITAREKMEAMRNEMDAKLKEIENIKGDVEALTNEFRQGGYLLQARIEFTRPYKGYGAFLKMIKAVRAALDVENKEEGYGWLTKELKEYMLHINNVYPFSGDQEQVSLHIAEYKKLYADDDEAIRKHDNYYLIRDNYAPLMADFEKRLNGIAQLKKMSFTEVGKEFKVE